MDLVSIIIPVYDVEPYLEQCIHSVVNQTYKNIEIILIDDGSPDRCPQICDEWKEKDSRILVIHKPNGGISDARNEGMRIAKGEYIAFVDSDDVVEPEYVEFLLDAVKKTGALVSECKTHRFVDDNELTVYSKEKKETVVQSQEQALFIFCNSFEYKNHNVWDKLYHRSIVEGENFAVGYRAQDVLFCCHIFAKIKEIALVEYELYNYRTVRQGSASEGFIVQRLHSFEMYDQSIRHLEKDFPEYARQLKVFCCSHFIGTADWLKGSRDKETKKRVFKQIVSYRKKISFSKEELKQCPLSDRIRILISSPPLIMPYVYIRKLAGRPD